MQLQKIFHIHQSLSETRTQLETMWEDNECFEGLAQKAISRDGHSECVLALPSGFKGNMVIEPVCGENENQIVFRSIRGNIELVGFIEFHAVKDNLTEVELVLDYTIRPLSGRLLDLLFRTGDRFVNNQLKAVTAYFDGFSRRSRPARALPQQSLVLA